MKVLLLLTAALVAVAQPAFPQASCAERLTLPQAVAEAMEKAPALKVTAAQEQAARLHATALSRTRFGQADGFASLSQYQDDQLIRPMSLQMFQSASSGSSVTNVFESLPWDRRQGHFGVTYQVPLYTGGRLSSEIDVASLAADQAALLVTGNTWELRANVVMLYSGAQALDAVSAAVAQHQKSLQMTRRRLRLMVNQGKRPRLDLLKVDEELQAAIAQRSGVAAEATRMKALLLALVGRDPQTPLAIDAMTEKEPQLKMDETQLKILVLDTSPVCRAAVREQQAQAGVVAARAAWLPSVLARGTWAQNYGLEIGEHEETWELSVALTIPIFTGGARSANVASARERARAAASAKEKARLDRLAQLTEALARLQAVRQQLIASEARVKTAVEAARIQQLRYDLGAGTIEELLRAMAHELAARAASAQSHGELIATAERLNAVCEQEVVQ